MKLLIIVSAVANGHFIKGFDGFAVYVGKLTKKRKSHFAVAVFFTGIEAEAFLGMSPGPITGKTGTHIGGIDGLSVFNYLNGNREFRFATARIVVGWICYIAGIVRDIVLAVFPLIILGTDHVGTGIRME